jgi:ubiquinone biosynthesis protein UbiJ
MVICNSVFEFISVLIFASKAIRLQGEIALSERILQACRELIDDAKTGCADLVFKEVCLEILSRARSVLTEKQFKQLVAYAAERMEEEIPFELQQKLMATR